MIRSSRASEPLRRAASIAALAATLAACASSGLQNTGDPDKPRRRPDGVAIDLVSAPPPARDRAESADGLVTLRTPLGVDRALVTIEELFRGIVREDGEAVEALFTRDALAITSTASGVGPGGMPQAALFWQQRFRRLDYTKLAGEPVYREAELEIYRGEDALEAPPHPAIRTDALNDNDVVIRLPILTPRVGTERLFGEEMIVWLRRDGERYRIYRILEDFTLN